MSKGEGGRGDSGAPPSLPGVLGERCMCVGEYGIQFVIRSYPIPYVHSVLTWKV